MDLFIALMTVLRPNSVKRSNKYRFEQRHSIQPCSMRKLYKIPSKQDSIDEIIAINKETALLSLPQGRQTRQVSLDQLVGCVQTQAQSFIILDKKDLVIYSASSGIPTTEFWEKQIPLVTWQTSPQDKSSVISNCCMQSRQNKILQWDHYATPEPREIKDYIFKKQTKELNWGSTLGSRILQTLGHHMGKQTRQMATSCFLVMCVRSFPQKSIAIPPSRVANRSALSHPRLTWTWVLAFLRHKGAMWHAGLAHTSRTHSRWQRAQL